MATRIERDGAQPVGEQLEAKFALAQEVGRVGCFEIDLRVGLTIGTPMFFALFGLPRDHRVMTPDQWYACIHPDDRDRMRAHVRRESQRPQPLTAVEYRVVLPGGAIRWLSSHTYVSGDADGTAVSAYGTLQDVTERKQAELDLIESREHLRQFVALSPAVFWTCEPDGTLALSEPACAEPWGLAPSFNIFSREASAFVHPDDAAQMQAAFMRSASSDQPFQHEYRHRFRDGQYRLVLTRATPRRDEAGQVARWYGMTEPIHEVRATELALADTQRRLALALDSTGVGAWEVRFGTDAQWFSDTAYAIQGYRPGDERPAVLDVRRDAHPDDLEIVRREVRRCRDTPVDRFEVEFRLRTKTGGWIWVLDSGLVVERDASGRALRMIGTRTDVTARRTAEERIRYLADHDPLTGLVNRRAFHERLERRLAAARPEERLMAMLIDLDGFKAVNDSFGHDVGDALLVTVAERLRAAVGGCATIARLGGDEFALFGEWPAHANLGALVSSISAALAKPVAREGRSLEAKASIGAALFPDHGRGPADLLKSADLALYAAKAAGRGTWQLFCPAMRLESEARTRMTRTLRAALARDRIIPHYQPQFCLRTGEVVALEALLRWNDGERLQGPCEFPDLLDEGELARDLGWRMLERIAADMRVWRDAGVAFGRVALNACSVELRQADHAGRLLGAIARESLEPGLFELEVTERAFLGRGSTHVAATLKTLAAAGMRIALDDFGTGFASLTHLRDFPVHTIKIDRSFVADLASDGGAAIVRAIVGLGDGLGRRVVAEGIETKAQADQLLALGCSVGQGFALGHPMPASAITERLRPSPPAPLRAIAAK